jgi:transposase-like protein
MPHHSSSEDSYGPSSVRVPVRVLPPPLSGAARASLLASSPVFPLQITSCAHHSATSAQATHPTGLPSCRLACTPSPSVRPAPALVRPWREVKSRRGAPKRVNTEGFACPNQQCAYCGITDAHMHALVGDGKHGQAERIQPFRGPACHTTFTFRRNTPLYRLKPPSHQVAMVLSALVEGLDPSEARRVFGFRQATITRLSVPCGLARANPARALLLPSPPAAPAGGRTAHPAALRQTGAVALAGHRSTHQDSSCASARPLHTTHGTPAYPLSTTDPGPWLSPALHW